MLKLIVIEIVLKPVVHMNRGRVDWLSLIWGTCVVSRATTE